MTVGSFTRKAGRILLFASGAFLTAFSIGNVIWAWIMVRPGSRKEYDCIDRIAFGKLVPVRLKTSDGFRLHAWVQWSQKTTLRRWVLILHGYRSNRNVLHTRRRFFVRRGYHVMLLHFRGHGGSESAPISYGFRESRDVKAAIDFIRLMHRGLETEIGIDGVSMGAAAAAYAAANESIHPDWIILESCYDDLRKALTNRLETRIPAPFVPAIARSLEFVGEHVFSLPMDDLNPANALKKIRCPVLVLAGDSEKVLKVDEVQQLYQNIPGPKRLVFFRGAAHGDLLLQDPRRYIKAVNAFLKEFSPSGHDTTKPPFTPENIDR